jgi:hypothetical protein
MLARVESRYGRRITLGALFRAPSVRGLARLLRSEPRDFDFRQMVRLQADGTRPPLIAINNTGVYYMLAKHLGPDQPVTTLQVFDPSVRRASLHATLGEIAAEYVQLIRRVHPHGPYVLAGWCVAGALAFEIAGSWSSPPAGEAAVPHRFVAAALFRAAARWRRLMGYHRCAGRCRATNGANTGGKQSLVDFFNRLMTVRRVRGSSRGSGQDDG